MREPRLGDDIDDFCVRCKRIMNHSVVSVLNNEPAKVRCRTCHSDHDFRHEQAPPPKVDPRKAALFNEVLKKVNPDDAAKAAIDDPDLPDVPELDDAPEAAEADEVGEIAGVGEAVEVVDEPPPAAKPKVKAKAKGKGRK
jgi:hypothetical protein